MWLLVYWSNIRKLEKRNLNRAANNLRKIRSGIHTISGDWLLISVENSYMGQMTSKLLEKQQIK